MYFALTGSLKASSRVGAEGKPLLHSAYCHLIALSMSGTAIRLLGNHTDITVRGSRSFKSTQFSNILVKLKVNTSLRHR